MKVLVTGTIGRVCQALLQRGDEVVRLTRDADAARGEEPQIDWHAWQPLEEAAPADALRDLVQT